MGIQSDINRYVRLIYGNLHHIVSELCTGLDETTCKIHKLPTEDETNLFMQHVQNC